MDAESKYKMKRLKEWDSLCAAVRRGLEKNGHDILIVKKLDTVREPKRIKR